MSADTAARRADAGASGSSGSSASLGELVAVASRDFSLLLHQEVELAKTEIRAAAISAGLGAGFLGAAGGLAFFAMFALTIAAAEGLHAAHLPRALCYVIVGVAYLVLAALLGLFAKNRLAKLKAPERTISTVKADVAWIKHPTVPPAT